MRACGCRPTDNRPAQLTIACPAQLTIAPRSCGRVGTAQQPTAARDDYLSAKLWRRTMAAIGEELLRPLADSTGSTDASATSSTDAGGAGAAKSAQGGGAAPSAGSGTTKSAAGDRKQEQQQEEEEESFDMEGEDDENW
eukprot:COSAG01_NODE_8101_length_2921_cov_70.806166_1_plen_139_part_00